MREIAVGTSQQGLSAGEAAARLQKNGKNKLEEEKKQPGWRRFLGSMTDPMILILLGAAVVQVIVTILENHDHITVGSFTDVFVIFAVVIINAVMSLVQENKAEAAVAALMEMTAETSRVYRDGEAISVKSEELVVGAFVITAALTLAAVYIPGFKGLFGIRGTMNGWEFLISVGLAVSTIPVFEIGKVIQRAVRRKK